MNLLLIYLVLSALTFVIYALDKSKARCGAWRIPESLLHFLALFGGWPGAILAQKMFRHKTQKRKFRVMFWITVIANCGALVWLIALTR